MSGLTEIGMSLLESDNSMSIMITLPSDIEWRDYQSELLAAAAGDILNFKVPAFPQHVGVGDKCYIVHRGYIRGWHTICGFSEKEFTCTTTGKPFKGKFIERTGPFNYLPEPLPYKGFQGFRYFKMSEYIKSLRQKELDENSELYESKNSWKNIKGLSYSEQIQKMLSHLPKVSIKDTVFDEVDDKYTDVADNKTILFVSYEYNTDILESNLSDLYTIKNMAQFKYTDVFSEFPILTKGNEYIGILLTKPISEAFITQIINDFNNKYGYFVAKWGEETDQNGNKTDRMFILFEPIEQKDIRNDINIKTLYHITPKYNLEEIMKSGLIPRCSSYVFKHPERIYFFYQKQNNHKTLKETLYANMMLFRSENKDPRNNGQYILLTIDVDKIPTDVKFYQDTRQDGGLFITVPISKDAITNVQHFPN